MKYFLVLLALLFGFWLWQQRRQGAKNLSQSTKPAPQNKNTINSPSLMRNCLHCGLLLPPSEVIEGRLGAYCNAQHCSEHEG